MAKTRVASNKLSNTVRFRCFIVLAMFILISKVNFCYFCIYLFWMHSPMNKHSDDKASEFLQRLLNKPYNRHCADCGCKQPVWAAIKYSLFICYDCSGRHRQLGADVSPVKSVTMDHWSVPELRRMAVGGNKLAAKIPKLDNFELKYRKAAPLVDEIDELVRKSEIDQPNDKLFNLERNNESKFSGEVKLKKKAKFGSTCRRDNYIPRPAVAQPKPADDYQAESPEIEKQDQPADSIIERSQPSRNISVSLDLKNDIDLSCSPFSFKPGINHSSSESD